MNAKVNTLALIIEHGLTVRQIPLSITNRWTSRPNQKLKDGEKFINIGNRKFVESTKTPVNAGKWMAKKCAHNDAQVRWNLKTDNLSASLDEAVLKASQDK